MNGKLRINFRVGVISLDVALIHVAMLIAYLLRYRLQWFLDVAFEAPFRAYLPFSLLLSGVIPLLLWVNGAYSRWRGRSWLEHVYHIVNAVAEAAVLTLALAFVVRPLVYSRLLLLEAVLGIAVLLSLDRALVMVLMNRLRRRGVGIKRVLIVGAGEVGRRVMRTIVARPDLGYKIVGYIDDNPEKGGGTIGRIQGLGPLSNLPNIINEVTLDEVIITLPWNVHRRILSVLRECERRKIEARIVPDIFQLSLSQVEVSDLGGVPLVSVHEMAFNRTALVFKRVFDIVVALLGLIVGAPVLALIALAIQLDSPGPAIFRQERVGQNGRHFTIYKFRSMRVGADEEKENLQALNEADGPLFKIRNDPRLTRIGRFLRRTSLDELPQLFNVIKGEMSLVGPRPPTPSEVDLYQPWHKKRLNVPPGITGLWQVSGRSELTFDEMVLLDLYYIEHWSPWMDFMILLRTIPKVLTSEGAY
jgi:exopolysaccharide biosynthesis polyprenyl glycosylphosphotransferase